MEDLDRKMYNAYREAIQVQNAVNLSGVVRSFTRHLETLWEYARAHNEGTEFVNRHPISVLFADKIADLTGASPFSDATDKAYRYCMNILEAESNG